MSLRLWELQDISFSLLPREGEIPVKVGFLILTHGASSHQVDHEDDPVLSGEQCCVDHLYWNTIHLERHSLKPVRTEAEKSKVYRPTSVLNESGCPYGVRNTSLPSVKSNT